MTITFLQVTFHLDLFASTFAYDMGIVDKSKMHRVGWSHGVFKE